MTHFPTMLYIVLVTLLLGAHARVVMEHDGVQVGAEVVAQGIDGRSASEALTVASLESSQANVSPVIAKRQNNNGQQYCGIGATADVGDINYLLYELTGSFVVPSRSCIRVACRETTGIYVNNDSYFPIELLASSIITVAQNIVNNCCTLSQGIGAHLAIMGQQFVVDNADWNVELGYGNCNDPQSSCLAQYGNAPGPNGACQA